jgi:hypothetical protein
VASQGPLAPRSGHRRTNTGGSADRGRPRRPSLLGCRRPGGLSATGGHARIARGEQAVALSGHRARDAFDQENDSPTTPTLTVVRTRLGSRNGPARLPPPQEAALVEIDPRGVAKERTHERRTSLARVPVPHGIAEESVDLAVGRPRRARAAIASSRPRSSAPAMAAAHACVPDR